MNLPTDLPKASIASRLSSLADLPEIKATLALELPMDVVLGVYAYASVLGTESGRLVSMDRAVLDLVLRGLRSVEGVKEERPT